MSKVWNPEGGFKPEVREGLIENIKGDTNKWAVWADGVKDKLSEEDKKELLPHIQDLISQLEQIKQLL